MCEKKYSKELVAEGECWFDLRRMRKQDKPLAFYDYKTGGIGGYCQSRSSRILKIKALSDG